MSGRFDLALFSTDPSFVAATAAAGVDAFVVDWERRGKEERQQGADTQIGVDGPEELARVRAATRATVICRVNGFGPDTADEVALACALGADEVLLPMVTAPDEVEAVLEMARARCRVGILVETPEAAARVEELARLPVARVFVGLNDLAIARGTPNLFTPIVDGLLERVLAPFRVPFGFGGLTLPEGGFPVPCRLLAGEMARLGCSFGFLRRSFLRDVRGRDPRVEIPRMRRALEDARRRSPTQVERDRRALRESVLAWQGTLFSEARGA